MYEGKELIPGTDYIVTYYYDNEAKTNVTGRTMTVTVTGKGNYRSGVILKYSIIPADIAQAAVSGVVQKTYTGQELTQDAVLQYGSVQLQEDRDYTVSYENNQQIGTATVTFTGCGNWTGSLSEDFRIIDPVDQMGADGTALGKGASAQAAEKFITTRASDKDPAGSMAGPLLLRSTKQTTKTQTVQWKKVSGASKYVLYGNKCGKSNKMKKIASVTGNKYNVKKAGGKKLKAKTYYKYIVVALDKDNNVVTASRLIYTATSGGKAANPKSVKIKAPAKNKVTVKTGKTVKIKASVTKPAKKKVKKYRAISFESTDPAVAAVSSKGIVTGKKKGSCKIYVYAQNGVYKTITVTVK